MINSPSIHSLRRSILILLPLIALASCSKNKPESYEVQGYVEATMDERDRLLVDHEEIPDFMPPMIMLFNVANPAEAEALQPGEKIRFTYSLTSERSWIENIRTTGEVRSPDESSSEKETPLGNSLSVGDYIPDYEFLDENGDTVNLSDYKGSVVALTFIFTRCPVPEYCPAMMRNFGNVDEILKSEASISTPWKLVTISFDPENDTPEVMKRYGKAFDYDPEHWDLLTSRTLEPIEGIAANVGLRYGKKDGSYLHNLRTVVLDTEGKIHHVFTTEDWSPEELAKEMLAAQH